jgi:hypothetical protein
MSFADDLREAADDLFEMAGESAVWNGQPLTVVEGKESETTLGSPGAVIPTTIIQVREAELGARPKAGAVVVYRGKTWSATPFPTASAGIWTVGLNQGIISL